MDEVFYGLDYIPGRQEFIDMVAEIADAREANTFYNNQEIIQLHKRPNPKYKLYNSYNIPTPNLRHEVDLLFLPNDRQFKYALTLIDCCTRYKAAIPMKNKLARTAKDALIKIYADDFYLKKPKKLASDLGSEFKGVFHTYLEDNNIIHEVTERGQHLAFIERFNGSLSRYIFKKQQSEELVDGETRTFFVDELPTIIHTMNNTITRMIKKTPTEAMIDGFVPVIVSDFDERDASKFHPIGTIVRYLLNRDEIEFTDDTPTKTDHRRTTDTLWSKETHVVTEVVDTCERCLKYHHITDTNRLFNYWSLQAVG